MPLNTTIRISLYETSYRYNVNLGSFKMVDSSIRLEEESFGINDSDSDTDRDNSLVILSVL